MKLGLAAAGVVAVAASFALVSFVRHGFSARDEPTAVEAFVARRLRHLSVPLAARRAENPVPLTDQVLAQGRDHFADHCAFCHGNDGRGETPIGRNLYPKAPDMRATQTQALSDGELFYIIENGVRLTGMPAWGEAGPHDDEASWQLVHFIRHLPTITPDEIAEMAELNPRSRRELEEQEEVRNFLSGEEPESEAPSHRH
jgi:mono/diheme cytochrome c family protein